MKPNVKSDKANPFDPSRWKTARFGRPRFAFKAATATDAVAWQRGARRRLKNRLGIGPTRASLAPKLHERVIRPGYTRQTVSFEGQDGLRVFGYFLMPEGASGPLPALLCCHGHGHGVDASLGIDAFGRETGETEYHNNFPLQSVRRGYAVLAIELLGFGRRREGEHAPGDGGFSCQTLSGTALMLGETLAGWRVIDAMRAVDYLETRSEVDRSRIGIMGISGGGLVALFAAALDLRLKAAMVSGYFNTFRGSVMSVPHCIDNFVPGLATDFEMSDIAALVAPRALWCENGTEDPIFPIAPFREAVRAARKIYSVMGVPAKFGSEAFSGDHFFHGVKAWPFLEKNL